ncbi:hypothetical protein [Halalkalibacter oceani]|uniref:hypothetical protein n=1 Tax=Halalkalibacter oceani TaxID=1653776 RepID=UPI0033948BAA
MIKTQTFSQLSQYEQIDLLSDLFAESIFTLGCIPFPQLSNDQQEAAIKLFHSEMSSKKIELNNKLIEAIGVANLLHLATACKRYGYTVINETPLQPVQEALSAHEGEKVTIIKLSDFGFPVAIQTTLKSSAIESYAQYENTLKIIHKPKRKRTYYSNRIMESDQLIVVNGWINLNESLTHSTLTQNEQLTVKQSKYSSFDKQYLSDILDSLNKNNLIIKFNL